VEYIRRFINKLRNATRFVQGMIEESTSVSRNYKGLGELLVDEKKLLSDYDVWILNKLQDVISAVTKYYDKFMLGEALQEIVTFVWHDFCDWYVEIVKGNQTQMTPTVMLYVL